MAEADHQASAEAHDGERRVAEDRAGSVAADRMDLRFM